MKSIASTLLVLIASLVLTTSAQARYADGMNLYAGYHAMHGALDPMGTTIIAKCEVSEWLIENKRVDAFDMKQIGDRDLYRYTGYAVYSHGDLDGEILATMIRSKRNFQITDGTIQNLALHVFARRQVVEATKAFSAPFQGGNNLNPKFWQLDPRGKILSTNDPSGAVDNVFDDGASNPMACGPGEIFCHLKGTLDAYRNEGLGGPGEGAFDNDSGGLTTDSTNKINDKNLFNRRAFVYDSVVPDPDDWVPGDGGYVENTSIPKGIEAGENVIYVGGGQWWGHGLGNDTLQGIVATVDGWSPDKAGDTLIHDRRTGPKIGLDRRP